VTSLLHVYRPIVDSPESPGATSADSGFGDRSAATPAPAAAAKSDEADEEDRASSVGSSVDESNVESLASEEAVAIYRRYVAPGRAERPLPLTASAVSACIQGSDWSYPLINRLINRIPGICGEDGSGADRNCFDKALEEVKHELEIRYWLDYVASGHHARYLLEALSNAGPKARDVLASDDLMFAFVEYADKADGDGNAQGLKGRDLVEFWTAASNFRRQVRQSDQV